MRLLCPAIRPYAQPGVLPLPSTDIYATFGMVSFFVGRLQHYRDWAWYTTDSRPKMGIGGMITPLLQFLNVPLGNDAAGPKFIDGTYLRIATYFSGMYGKDYVYHYYLQGKPVEVVLSNQNLTSLEIPGAISFNIPQEYFLGEHGPLDPVHAAPSRRRSVPTRPDSPVADTSEHIYGPPRYYFKPHDGVLPPGALRDAHDRIGRLQRWNKAHDRTIEKLKDKCKALSKTVKKQAKTSAKFMKKVADVLTRRGIAGCSSADFAFANTSNPQSPPPPEALGFPLTAAQLQRKWRNPPTQPSTSSNKSPSLASSDSEVKIDEDIGRVMGFQDLEDHSLPKCENLPTELWKLITGNKHTTGADKNSHIRHPSVRYLHRMLVHAFYPRKQAGTVTEEDMRLLCPAIRPYAQPGVLPLPSTDIYATFGMDAAGPKFIDGTYLRIATYFSGMYGKDYVYQYYLQGKPVEVVLPNRNLTSLEIPGVISFNIPQEYFLGEHGHLDPVHAAPSRRRSVPTRPDSPVADTCEHIYGPPHYYFKPHDGVLPPGALRDAHDHIGRLQRWNKAQDGTIEKLKDKCNALSKTGRNSSADFAFANTSNPQPPPPPDALGFPLTAAHLQCKWRNPPTQPSTSGNKSPSLASSDSEVEIDEVESQPWSEEV
ncbi:hypothetical protein F2Q70_00020345 [Brassica cretica]|uniref:Arabidopsis retrotransposon Orf1 C-terminal domain-containing protein n=1 Tax=Brassica cretica TaxID=69181 RepID=A0A8S9GVT8_BRACR|nr:hypothetical protein F2Q70_00020345 [Brassica cretica]